jgi:hypothetical protein
MAPLRNRKATAAASPRSRVPPAQRHGQGQPHERHVDEQSERILNQFSVACGRGRGGHISDKRVGARPLQGRQKVEAEIVPEVSEMEVAHARLTVASELITLAELKWIAEAEVIIGRQAGADDDNGSQCGHQHLPRNLPAVAGRGRCRRQQERQEQDQRAEQQGRARPHG